MKSEESAKIAVTQVNQIINKLKEEDKAKIPLSVRNFFEKYSQKNIEQEISFEVPLEKQNISGETKVLLKYIYSYIK